MHRLGLLLLAAALGATPALADGQLVGKLTAPLVEPNSWYVTMGGGVEVTNLQKWDILWNATSGLGNPVGYGDDLLGGGYQFTLGHVFGRQLDPQIWGGRLHLSASGSYLHASSESTIGSSPGIVADMINFTAGFPFLLLNPLSVDFSSEYHGFGAELRAGVDYTVDAGFLVTPSLSLFGGSTDLKQTAFIEERPDSPSPHFFDRLSQEVRTDRIGATLGLGASYALGGGLYLKGGAEVGMAYAATKGTISQCAGGLSATRVCNGAFFDETASLQASALALVAGGGLGLDYDLGFAVIGLAGQANYDGTTASFDYPDFPGDRLHLEHVGSWSYGGGITVTVPLN